jgi:sugar transferase (PEP-CTERM/EpsH1 system associated)
MRILWLKNNLLHPLDSGGKIRSYNILHRLKRRHEVDFACYADADEDGQALTDSTEYCHRVFSVRGAGGPAKGSLGYALKVAGSFFDRYPFTVSSYTSDDMRDLVTRLVRENGYDVIVADFLAMCLNIPDAVDAPRVHFSHNVERMIWDRHVRCARNPLKKIVFARERNRVGRFEKGVINGYALTIAVSRNDREYFRSVYGGGALGDVMTGVDVDFFSPGEEPVTGADVLFLGSMDWMPNIDAVLFFIRHVFPAVREAVPDATLSIVGRNPTDEILSLAKNDAAIRVTGTVPDVRPYVARASCAVVPIRIGGGTRLKIYEMMAMGKAVVSTTIGAEGLEYERGGNILVEDDPGRFAGAVARLLRDGPYREEIGRSAREFVERNCSWETVAERFGDLLTQVEKDNRS